MIWRASTRAEREAERFWRKVAKEPGDGCWRWLGQSRAGHRGKFKDASGRTWPAVRYAWRWMAAAELPAGIALKATCGQLDCVRPSHMRPMLAIEVLRTERCPSVANAKKTHCVHGHALAGENLYLEGTRRKCRTCFRARSRALAASFHRRRRSPKPDRDTLAKLLKKHSACAIGRAYGVSDVAVRNWAKGYGLPLLDGRKGYRRRDPRVPGAPGRRLRPAPPITSAAPPPREAPPEAEDDVHGATRPHARAPFVPAAHRVYLDAVADERATVAMRLAVREAELVDERGWCDRVWDTYIRDSAERGFIEAGKFVNALGQTRVRTRRSSAA
jgi:hypothetical protein